MKKIVVALALAVSLTACPLTPGQKQVVNTVLNATQYLCVLANATLANDAIAEACAIDKAALPLIEQLISAHKAAASKEFGAARSCPLPAPAGDAGATFDAGASLGAPKASDAGSNAGASKATQDGGK